MSMIGGEDQNALQRCAQDGERCITWLPKNMSRGDSIRSPSSIGLARTRGDFGRTVERTLPAKRRDDWKYPHVSGVLVSPRGFEIPRAAKNCNASTRGVGQAALLLWHGPSTCRASPTVEMFSTKGNARLRRWRVSRLRGCAEINCPRQLPTEIVMSRLDATRILATRDQLHLKT